MSSKEHVADRYTMLKPTLILIGASLLSVAVAFLNTLEIGATLKYKKETEKKCTYCHTGIPEPGDEDPQLTENGRKFKGNNFKLTPEQRREPN